MVAPLFLGRGKFINPGLPKIDYRHQLAGKLCFLHLAAAPNFDLVSGVKASTLNANIGRSPSAMGQALTFGNGNSLTDGVIWASYHPLTSSVTNGTGDFTVGVYANPSASAQQNCLFSQRINTGSIDQVTLFANVDNTNAQNSGWFTIQTYSGTFVQAGAASKVDGGYHAFVGTRNSTSTVVTAYRDGLSVATASGTNQTVSLDGQSLAVGTLPLDTSDSRGANCSIVMAAAWNRALSANEILQWSQDPTCFLIYPQDIFYPSNEIRGNIVLRPVQLIAQAVL